MNIPLKAIALVSSGLVLGAGALLGIRFATYDNAPIHYHANFAVYINGQREEFKNPIYYVDANCTVNMTSVTPYMRAHMHDNVNDVVHVEDEATTWSQFFNNLGWYVGPDTIQRAGDEPLVADDVNKLRVILNGKDFTGTSMFVNSTIGANDKLLISYGNEDDQTLDREYNAVADTATQYDIKQDPSSCSGTHKTTVKDKLRHLF